jgi:acetoin utilization deacetylase AcuC-like enzyme
MNCGVVYDSFFEKHTTGFNHPEKFNRATVIHDRLKKSDLLEKTGKIKAVEISEENLCLAHDRNYLKKAKFEIERGANQLSTGDTNICPNSWKVGSLASGGVVKSVDQIINGDFKQAFCITRPPGHHANSFKGMGFCLFNHVALAARYAQKKFGLGKVLIVDWDVHHGNGTQDIFYEDDSVFFFSTHQSPWYPGTGRSEETGKGKGLGYTLNLPLPSGSGRKEIIEHAFSHHLPKYISRFKPELILISAGFDSRMNDPLGQFTLDDNDFYDLTNIMLSIAKEHSESRVISVLEGGYNLKGLASASESHLKAFIDFPKTN